MKSSNGFKIRTKLIAGFLTVALIVAIVGFIGYNATNKIYNIKGEFTERRLPSVQSLLIISEAQTSINNSVNQILINVFNEKDYDLQLAEIEDAFKRAESEWEAYTAMSATVEEEKMQKEYMLFWNVWKKSIDEFVELANEYNTSKSDDIKIMMNLQKV